MTTPASSQEPVEPVYVNAKMWEKPSAPAQAGAKGEPPGRPGNVWPALPLLVARPVPAPRANPITASPKPTGEDTLRVNKAVAHTSGPFRDRASALLTGGPRRPRPTVAVHTEEGEYDVVGSNTTNSPKTGGDSGVDDIYVKFPRENGPQSDRRSLRLGVGDEAPATSSSDDENVAALYAKVNKSRNPSTTGSSSASTDSDDTNSPEPDPVTPPSGNFRAPFPLPSETPIAAAVPAPLSPAEASERKAVLQKFESLITCMTDGELKFTLFEGNSKELAQSIIDIINKVADYIDTPKNESSNPKTEAEIAGFEGLNRDKIYQLRYFIQTNLDPKHKGEDTYFTKNPKLKEPFETAFKKLADCFPKLDFGQRLALKSKA